jgi:glycosyltransferase involved in cell wall biosynthesis
VRRPDLVCAFPEVPGRDTAHFHRWCLEHGSDVPIPDLLLPSGSTGPLPIRSRPPIAEGVNLVGYLDDALGIGEVARRIALALEAADVPCHLVPFARTRQNPGPPLSTHAGVNVVCVNPDSLMQLARQIGEHFFRERYTIGVWFWETDELPPSYGWAFDLVDEVWAASAFVADAIRRRAPAHVPVKVFRLPLEAPVVAPDFRLADLGLDNDKPAFTTSWDYLSVVDRKNPIAVVDAYRAAFTEDDGAQLVLKSINAAQRRDAHERVRYAARSRSDIVLVDDRLTPEANAALLAKSACFVSLHRSEGLGLNLSDAIALGTPTVATNYGGNLAFMDSTDTWLIPYRLAPVGPDRHPYPFDAHWAEPDIDAAARTLRAILDDPGEARRRADHARLRLADTFSTAQSARDLVQLLSEIGFARAPREPKWRPATVLRRTRRRMHPTS